MFSDAVPVEIALSPLEGILRGEVHGSGAVSRPHIPFFLR